MFTIRSAPKTRESPGGDDEQHRGARQPGHELQHQCVELMVSPPFHAPVLGRAVTGAGVGSAGAGWTIPAPVSPERVPA
jgi:hypothetical protein